MASVPVESTTADSTNAQRAETFKAILLLVLLLLTFLTGLLPFVIRRLATHGSPEQRCALSRPAKTDCKYRRRRYALVFTLLSCYGGGVFLGTCLLDLLPGATSRVGDY